MMRSRLILALLAVLGMGSCARVPEGVPIRPAVQVRVGLQVGAARVKIAGTRAWAIWAGSGTKRVRLGKRDTILLTAGHGEVRAYAHGRLILVDTGLRLASIDPKGVVMLDGRKYRGQMDVVLSRKGGLTVVNVVNLEDYLRGVVPAEMGRLPKGCHEALKAQTIAARSYALAHMGRRDAYGFDFFADVRDQAYGGLEAETKHANRAVRETAGLVGVYGGKPVSAFYCANCGGHTASIEHAWGKQPIPYLQGVRDASDGQSFGKTFGEYRWKETWERRELEHILSANLPGEVRELEALEVGELRDLSVLDRSPSGRVQTLEIRTSEATYRVSRDRIRWVLRRPVRGHPVLRSTYFTLRLERDAQGALIRVIAIGGGNGHGVGMCQAGAIGMARSGYQADEILRHYYPGIQIVQWPSQTPVASTVRKRRPKTEPPRSGSFALQILVTRSEAKAQATAAEARLLTDAPVVVAKTGAVWKVFVGDAATREGLTKERMAFQGWGFDDCWVAER